MISRIYIDNYRCFVNFEWRPGMQSLLLGENGNGKTSVFDVLELLVSTVVRGSKIGEAFPSKSLTAWDKRTEQTLELQVQGNSQTYDYRLVIEQHHERDSSRIRSERLTCDGQPVFVFDGNEVHLFRDDGSGESTFAFDSSRSAMPLIPSAPHNTRLTWFRERLDRVVTFAPDPHVMESLSPSDEDWSDRNMANLVSWLRHLQQESVDLLPQIRNSLQDVLPGFENLRLDKAGETARVLKLEYEADESGKGTRFLLSLNDLSDGQRMLVALYSILHGAIAANATICIDEPDNFVSLREIQPWLIELKDRAADTGCQWMMISHHPEVTDHLAADCGHWFHRVGTGPVRVRPFACDKEGLFKPSEVIARGWASE